MHGVLYSSLTRDFGLQKHPVFRVPLAVRLFGPQKQFRRGGQFPASSKLMLQVARRVGASNVP